MAWHKSNVDFRRGNLHDGRAKRGAHHFGRDPQSRWCLACHPCMSMRRFRSAGTIRRKKCRAAAHANTHGRWERRRKFPVGEAWW